jgi:hypothetical protein
MRRHFLSTALVADLRKSSRKILWFLPAAVARFAPSCPCPIPLFHSAANQPEERIMAKGQMKSNKEARKPKKDAKKPAAAPALKAAPVPAAKLKDKK